MKRLLATAAVCLGAACWTARLDAQGIPVEGIYTRDNLTKPAHKGEFVIASESPRSVVLKGKGEVPAEDIDDIVFPLQPLPVRTGPYRQGIIAERKSRAATKEAERDRSRAEALAKYEETLGAMAADQPLVKAHLEFKSALLRYLQASDAGKEEQLKAAVGKLRTFATKHPKAWQVVRVLRTMAQAYLDLKQPADAEKTYLELAKSDAAPEVRQDAEVQAVLVTMQAGKHAEAQAKLQGLVDKLPAGSVQKTRARLALAECLGLAEKTADAKKLVKEVLDETKDKKLRGLAHGTLGLCYWHNKQWQDARWEFLWVDTIYNQDKAEHARALYYLADIFSRLGEGDRSAECRALLLNDENFRNSEYQRRALREEKTP